jgi:hypothetical protein
MVAAGQMPICRQSKNSRVCPRRPRRPRRPQRPQRPPQYSNPYRSQCTEPEKKDQTVFSEYSPRASETNYDNFTRCLRTDLPDRCLGEFACFTMAINQINKRIDNLNKVLNQSDILQSDRERYEGIKDRLNFRLLVISRFIDLFHDAKDIKLFGWGTANKVTPDNTKAPSELSGVQCKINGKEVYLNFNSTIGRFEQLSKELEWQTSFETKNAQWYFSSTDPNFNSSLAEFTKPIKLPSQRETEEAILLSDSPQKPRRQPQLRPTLPPKHSKEDTVCLLDGGGVSACLVLNPLDKKTPSSPRHSDAGWFLPDQNKHDLSGRSDRLSVDRKDVDHSLSPYPAFATPPQLNSK